ncbi:hypothetical protein [Actinoplanes sp. NPDC049265]|uniref:hypothetical protein n=1 Tax=Actinoplanes sp. NPDC049265 TaxID=3363902 RepID=UPI003714F1A3
MLIGAVMVLGTGSGCATVAVTASPPPAASSVPAGSPVPVQVRTVATPKPRTAAPGLATTGTAWPAVLSSLARYGQWILANPDPAQVGAVATPGCAFSGLLSQQADGLLRDNAYLVPSAPVFGPITGPTAAGSGLGTTVTLNVTASRPAEVVMSRSGRQITAYDTLAVTPLQITLMQGADRKWRFCTVDAMSDAGAPDDPSVPLL